ncbi:hypothetical protein GCK72_002450 [Caenorhabditis remanei]|uniref:Uncharacterized protein n=1 Tax=Caenorhabditis remanei TaxID=31234 RepID=A0A6A5HQY6_CAERE|nr:hypothetical protein GCK72_002450 [Caenorhabditis remanei]KAF1770630.1 hypothetical protein GCK72_002450 [Caenorhabditis remanei]
MDEESRLSSSQPSTSSSGVPSDSSVVDSDTQKTSKAINKRQQAQQQERPSTSKACKSENCEFGYTDALPFAPWRRKRYGLTVQGLHEEIVDMYHWIKPNEIESRLRTKVYEKVRDSVLQRWKHKAIKISMFGSLRTNLFLPTSDIDVLVECEDWVGSSSDWLAETARGLEMDNIAESVMVYGGAYVPIVKMVDRDTRLSIDISFNTVQGVRAASYIAKVKEEFPLIEPLVLLLKQFLHYRNLNQTFTGGLSSYGLVLLLVNFFQLYALNMRHRTIYDRGVNLGHLLLRFLELYSLEFNYEEMGISPGQCCYIPKSAAGARYGHKRAQPGNLALEDPLLTANDVGRSTYNFTSIANAFGQALQILMVAVTLRERKGRNQLATKVYRGSLLHMIMPFTSKELTYRNWLMSGVLSVPCQDTPVTYDLNQLHNTLVSPMVDLSRYAWLRKTPSGAEKRDAKPLKITNPADDVKNQVLLQLKERMQKEKESQEAAAKKLKEEENSASLGAEVEDEDARPDALREQRDDNDNGLILTGPPLPTSTASVNTSATVSTAASISEREDTDSPGLSSSLGAPSSEEDDDDSSMSNIRKTSDAGVVSIQFKKQFSEVVKTQKEFSKRTQTNFDDRKMEVGANGTQFGNINHFYPQQQPPSNRNFIDYAAAVASTCGTHKHRQTYAQRNRQSRNHSQGSDISDGYDVDRKNMNNNNQRGRRNVRAPSSSSNHSRQSSGSRSSGLNNHSYFPMPSSIDFQPRRSQHADATSTDESGNGSAMTSTSDEPRSPRMYADAVKKKSSVSTNTSADMNFANGNVPKNGVVSQSSASVGSNTPNNERSYRNAVVVPTVSLSAPIPPVAPCLPSQIHHNLRKDNECGLDTQSLTCHPNELSRQPQLISLANRSPR